MFFDDNLKDERHGELLKEIAKKQQELFLCKFDMKTCTELDNTETVGFFKKKTIKHNKYVNLETELEQLKEQLIQYRKMQGYSQGTFWWNIPWEQVEKYLLYDLTRVEMKGSWRWEYTWQIHRAADGTRLLLFCEEGKYTSFTTTQEYIYTEESKYSKSEREQMVSEFNRKLDNDAFWDIMISGSTPVYSEYHQKYYESASAYYDSWDYRSMREAKSTQYANSLFTEHETNAITAHNSGGKHYKCDYAVAEFNVDNSGCLSSLKLHNFKAFRSGGDISDFILSQYEKTDSAVASAFYLAGDSSVVSVPMKLFGKDIDSNSVTYDEAMRQSEIFTCLADKIVI